MVKRPIVRYHGGKFLLAPWIISHFPHHRVYTETFGGGGSVLLRKTRSYAEVYNDLDGEIVNLFRQARDNGPALREALFYTPFARNEFVQSYDASDDPLEQARRTIVRSFMGFSSPAASGQKTGFRSNSNRSGTTPAHDWRNYSEFFDLIIDRLRGVIIENKDAKEVIKTHDSDDCLHYVDPPYVMETRSDGGSDYRFEMNDADHEDLALFLNELKGLVVISGYPSELYDRIFDGWKRIDRSALADGAAKRIECLWFSPKFKSGMLF